MPIDRKSCVELRVPMHALERRKSLREASKSCSGTEEASVYALRQVEITEANGACIKSVKSGSRVAHQYRVRMNDNSNVANVE